MSTEPKSPRARKRAAKWRLAQMIKVNSGCIDCGYNKNAVALQFDHVNDDKKANVSNLIRSDYAWSTILTEIKKCEIRCANCHAAVTAARKQPSYHESAQSKSYSAPSEPKDQYGEGHSQKLVPLSLDVPQPTQFGVPAWSSAWFLRLFEKTR